MQTAENIISAEGLKRIFEGELVPQMKKKQGTVDHYRVLGFRLEDPAMMKVRGIVVDEESKSSPDVRGAYLASITVQGVSRGRRGFFPAGWTAAQVVSAIAEAYETRETFLTGEPGHFCKGRTREGIKMILQLDEAGRVLDARPERARIVNKARESKFKLDRGLIKKSPLVCGKCGKIKLRVCPSGHDVAQPIGVGFYVERVLRRTIRRVLAKVKG
jgi:hypothetical protein